MESSFGYPRMLIIIRAGRSSIHRSWIWTAGDLADIAISTYDESDFESDGVRFTHHFRGGKFPGIFAFLREHPQVFDDYDYFWLFEDDLILPYQSLRKILALLSCFPFDLSAASLSQESFFTWPIAVTNSQFNFRCTDFVEVMMPIMSRKFLSAAAPAFNDNFSGWGHEWLWRKLLRNEGDLAAIFDDAPVTHTRPFNRGSLSGYRPTSNYDPDAELNAMISKWGLDAETPFRNYFAVTRGASPEIVYGKYLIDRARLGYEAMRRIPNDAYERCLDFLRSDSVSATEAALATQAVVRVHEGLRLYAESGLAAG